MSPMKKEKYNVLPIRDPSSESHVVYLFPDQSFEVYITDKKLASGLQVNNKSPYFELDTTKYTDRATTYRFRPKKSIEHWSRVSTCYLGEILIQSTLDPKYAPRLCLYLQSTNPYKRNIITAVNPDKNTIKIHSYQIIEMVVFAPIWGEPLYYEVDKETDPRMELMAHGYIQPKVYNCESHCRKINDAFFTLPRVESDREFYEYHFWFRCKQDIANDMKELPVGSYPSAKISVTGYVGLEAKVHNEINVLFNTRPRNDPTAERTAKVSYKDSNMQIDAGQSDLAITSIGPRQQEWKRSRETALPAVYKDSSLSTQDRTSYNHSRYVGSSSTTTTYRTSWNSTRDVNFENIPGDIGQGCRIIYLDEIDVKKSSTVYYAR